LVELSRTLIIIVEGNWDELEFHDEPIIKVAAWRPYEYVIWVVKTVFICLFPLAIYLCLKHFMGMQLAAPLETYVQTALIIWTLVSMLTVIDPLVKDKIASVKDILSVTVSERK
jgi:hypothetical protein